MLWSFSFVQYYQLCIFFFLLKVNQFYAFHSCSATITLPLPLGGVGGGESLLAGTFPFCIACFGFLLSSSQLCFYILLGGFYSSVKPCRKLLQKNMSASSLMCALNVAACWNLSLLTQRQRLLNFSAIKSTAARQQTTYSQICHKKSKSLKVAGEKLPRWAQHSL